MPSISVSIWPRRSSIGARALIVVMTLLLCGQFPGPVMSQATGGDGVPGSHQGPDGPEWWELASYKGSVEIDAGRQYYVGFDPEEMAFRPLELPAMEAGFSSSALDAIALVPEWIKEDLAIKFAQIADRDVTTGPYSSPTVGDLDKDGDLDLVIGDDYGVRFYENMGTSEWPVFVPDPSITLVGGFGDPSQGGLGRWAPSVGDLTGDGYPDLVLGDGGGTLFIYENIPGGFPVAFDGPYPIGNIDVGANSHPELGDIDDDGDLDMVIGSNRGSLDYYENTGSNGSYAFTSRPLRFQGIDVGEDSAPALGDLDDDDDLDLTVGSASQGLFHYNNVGGTFILDATVFAGLNVGAGTSPMVADLHPDSCLDLFVGLQDGTVLYFDNIGDSEDVRWQTWSSFDLFEGVAYYPRFDHLKVRTQGVLNRYADIIISVEERYRDEVAFSIAHTAPEVLRALNDTQAQIFVDNVRYIYIIEGFLDYAELVEKDDYTTVRYKAEVSGGVVERELPRDIYYWYVVHPQITDEVLHYIDPDTGNAADPDHGGRFWREYLFFHADDAYPPDPDPIDPNRIYPDTPPPLLKDVLSGIDVIFNDTTWRAPDGRDIHYGDHGVIRVSNWVGKTLFLNEQESGDGERPVQPVRIAHGHNGNCGELQDLTIAAARTALLPAKGVSMPGEDHVWIEFYEEGWHQWDNYWSDGGAAIDNFGNYWDKNEWWQERGGAGIFAWRGDDSTWEVTQDYVDPADISKVTFRVVDRSGDPVDGARIVVASHWLIQTGTDPVEITIPFPSIWNYTDYNGISTLYLAAQKDVNDANQNFSFKVVSRVGQAEQGKTALEQGVDYTFDFVLEGAVPRAELSVTEVPLKGGGDLRMSVDISSGNGLQRPLNPVDERTQPFEVRPEGDQWAMRPMGFVVDEENLGFYLKGLDFDSYGLINSSSQWSTIDVPLDRASYLVFSTEGQVESSRKVSFDVLVEGLVRAPVVTIDGPMEGATFPLGSLVNITGTAMDPFGLTELEISTDGGSYYKSIVNGLENDTWEHKWYTAGEVPGNHRIIVRAMNGHGLSTSANVNVTLEDLDLERPVVNIDRPLNMAEFDEGETIEVKGTGTDNVKVDYLGISLNGGGSWIDITKDLVTGHWTYRWDTRGKPAGEYTLMVKAKDPSGNEESDWVKVVITGQSGDSKRPLVSITYPYSGTSIEAGTAIKVEGTAEDDIGVEELTIAIEGPGSDGKAIGISYRMSQGRWSYNWYTTEDDIGQNTITVVASDAAGNTAMASVQITLREEGGSPPPDPDHPPVIDVERPQIELYEPLPGAKVTMGDLLMVYGKASDDSGKVYVHIGIDGKLENITDKVQAGYFSTSFPTSDLTKGTHEVSFKVVDPAGNEVLGSISFTVKEKAEEEEDLLDLFSFLPPEVCFVLFAIALVVLLTILVSTGRRHRSGPQLPQWGPVRKKRIGGRAKARKRKVSKRKSGKKK